MPSALENAAARFRRELLNQEREAASAMVRVYGESWQRVSQRIADLQAQIAEAGPLLEPSWLFQFDRLTTLQAQIEAEIRRFMAFAADATTANQMRAIQAAGRHAAGFVDLAAGVRPVGVEVPFDVLPVAALQELVGFASDGSPLRDLFGEISGSVADGVTDTFVSSIAAGYNSRVTARLLRQAFGVGLRRALTIARTETIRAYTEATHRNYLNNRDVVEAWVWCSALDSRTCPACWAMHGSIHPLDERLFDHPNGRCSQLPRLVPWARLGYNVPDRRPKVATGAEVFATLTPNEQRQILGPVAFAAFRDGIVSLEQFAAIRHSDDWGDSVQRESLTALIGADAVRRYMQEARN